MKERRNENARERDPLIEKAAGNDKAKGRGRRSDSKRS